jgi:hypothetical protein
VSILSRIFDERFLVHRLRSTSTAGITVAAGSLVLFEYRFVVDHVLDWDLLGVGCAFVVVKLLLMVWYSLKN